MFRANGSEMSVLSNPLALNASTAASALPRVRYMPNSAVFLPDISPPVVLSVSSCLGTEPSVARPISIHDSDRSDDSAKRHQLLSERVEEAIVAEQHHEDFDAALPTGRLRYM
jgi:hypothetical protein